MALISDTSYILHFLRLSHLRATDDPHSSRIIPISPLTLATNPYVRASGLADVDAWPEITTGLDSPTLDGADEKVFSLEKTAERRNRRRLEREKPSRSYVAGMDVNRTENGPGTANQTTTDPNVSLKYSATIGKTDTLSSQFGMRLSSRRPVDLSAIGRSNSATNTTAHAASATPTHPTYPRRHPSNLSSTDNNFSRPSTNPLTSLSETQNSPSSQRTPTTRTLSGLGRSATIAAASTSTTGGRVPSTPTTPSAATGEESDRLGEPFEGPLDGKQNPRRHNRPRADSAPVLIVTSPGGGGGGLANPTDGPPTSPHLHRKGPPPSLARRMVNKQIGSLAPAFSPLMSALSSAAPSGLGGLSSISGGAYDGYGDDYGSILENALSGSVTNTATGTGTSLDGDVGYGDGEDDELRVIADVNAEGGAMSIFNEMTTEGDDDEGDEVGLGGGAGVGLLKSGMRRVPYAGDRSPSANGEVFVHRPITHPTEQSSALSLLFNPPKDTATPSTSATSSNPFFSTYASVAPPTNSTLPASTIQVYFPHSSSPFTPIQVKVRKDVTVEEVIGWSLAKYWDEGVKPRLDEGLEVEGRELERQIRLSTIGWALRIVEDDGEVDEDFPALDRDGQLSKFSFSDFAVVEATPAQVRQNLAKQPLPPLSTLPLPRPGNLAASRDTTISAVSSVNAPPLSRTSDSMSSFESAMTGPSGRTGVPSSAMSSTTTGAGGGVMVLLRVNVTSSADIRFKTTINVPSEMYFADIIELLTKKKHLTPSDPREWVLLLGDASMALPLDRTVESLMGAADLALVRRSWAESHGLVARGKEGEMRGGDPNTSIFKRMSEPPSRGQLDFTSTYKKYLVQRKMPIGRHERILAIDGDYIHIMPSDNKAFFDSMKTSSFHVTSIVSCKQSSKSPASFKIVIGRDGADKRYDFEAESAKQASEIIGALRNLMKLYQSDRNLTKRQETKSGRRL